MKAEVMKAVLHPGSMSRIGFEITADSGDVFSDRGNLVLTLPGVNLLYSDPNCLLIDKFETTPLFYQLHEQKSEVNVISGKIYTEGPPSDNFAIRCYFVAPEAPLKDKIGTLHIDFEGEDTATLDFPFPMSVDVANNFAVLKSAVASGKTTEAVKGLQVSLENTTVATKSFHLSIDGAYFYNLTPVPAGSPEGTPRPAPTCTVQVGETSYAATMTLDAESLESENKGVVADIALDDPLAEIPVGSDVSISCLTVSVAQTVKFYEPIIDIADPSSTYNTYGVMTFDSFATKPLVGLTTAIVCGLSLALALF